MSDKRQKVLELWNSFSAAVIPPNAPADQKLSMRLAFYGGCSSLMRLIMVDLTAGPDAQPGDEAMLAEIQEELGKFAKDTRSAPR